jgi:hypothetical protein
LAAFFALRKEKQIFRRVPSKITPGLVIPAKSLP